MPKVSVCIPAYNQVAYLKKALDSVITQTYSDYEIIVTDDSPGDMVKELVDQYKFPQKIKYFKNKVRLGSPENWNEAIRRSTGEYIKILHYDDWLNGEESLEKYVQLLDDHPEADMAFSATQAIDPAGTDWVHVITPEQLESLAKNPLLLYGNNLIGAPSTTIMRRPAGFLFDPNLKWLVDKEFYIRQLSRNNKLAYSPELLVVTFLAEGRVTDECIENKAVEVFEYVYVLEKIFQQKKQYTPGGLKQCLLQAISICDKYQVRTVKDIRDCGYHGTIYQGLKTYLTLQGLSAFLGKIYKAILRRI